MDPHKKSVNAVAAIDENGELLAHKAFPANRAGLWALERWSKRFPERRWAVEGAAGIGRPVAQKLSERWLSLMGCSALTSLQIEAARSLAVLPRNIYPSYRRSPDRALR